VLHACFEALETRLQLKNQLIVLPGMDFAHLEVATFLAACDPVSNVVACASGPQKIGMERVNGNVGNRARGGHEGLRCNQAAEQPGFAADTAFTRPAEKFVLGAFPQLEPPQQSVDRTVHDSERSA